MTFKQVWSDSKYPVKVWTDTVEEQSKEQMQQTAQMDFIHKWIALMPDVHKGIGCSVGAVVPTKKAIIPATVGVDIGCGMMAAKLNLKAKDLPDNLFDIRHSIEREIPLGPGGEYQISSTSDFDRRFHYYEYINNDEMAKLSRNFDYLTNLNEFVLKKNWAKQLGTLGSGNHFIEICLDENQDVWIMLHSGSRGIGNMIARQYIELAKEDMRKYYVNLPNESLAYLPEGTEHFDEYIAALLWAQNYASINRRMMMAGVMHNMKHYFPQVEVVEQMINCHHNYAEKEHHYGENVWVTRKGAIRAREGDFGIIPGSMGDKSYIVKGKGNAESFHSCSHGAGRTMSRTKAKEKFTVDDLKEQTKGVECSKGENVIDEIPGAYKDIDTVMDHQKDLVSIVHTLKQVVCVKGN